MKQKLIFVMMLIALMSQINAATTSYDNLGKQVSFVIKGRVNPDFGDTFKMAVSGYIDNKGIDIPIDEDRNFSETITFQGPLQEAYIYVDKTVTIPVEAGDTVIVDCTGKEVKLSSPNPVNDHNLKFAKLKYDNMRDRFININRTAYTANTDSAKAALADSINAYINDYRKLLSDYEKANGPLSKREYFINDAFFEPSRFIANKDDMLKRITVAPPESKSERPVFSASGLDMIYPSFREFMIAYLRNCAHETSSKIWSDEPLSYRNIKIVRAMAPDLFIADLINAYQLRTSLIFESYEEIEKYAQPTIESIQTEWLKDEISKKLNTYRLTASGSELPQLTLKDKDGKNVSLDKFKGKIVLLDFWAIGCGPCMTEFSKMEEFNKAFADKADQLQIITVCCHKPSKKAWQKIIDKYKLDDLNTILVPDKSAEVYSSIGWPTYVLIGKDGKILEWNTMRPSHVLAMKKRNRPTSIDKAIDN